ncbi:hypothetical protein SAY87_002847 [Trapa incisa]|uniref:Uncharacterized protein n=1 Tax=Trapa incisa TaxID=236973 RepID=A0AAN7KPA7_9MYRT|nr:hypothetical protein SAY87_002847 [Trapa incisa]
MDFGVGGLVGSDPDVKQKLYGSGFFKQLERPSSEDAGDDRGGSEKVAKLGDNDDHSFSVSASKAAAGAAAALLLPQRSSGNDLSSGAQQSQHLLCFSTSSALHSQKPEPQSPALPCLSSYPPSTYSNYAGGKAVKILCPLQPEKNLGDVLAAPPGGNPLNPGAGLAQKKKMNRKQILNKKRKECHLPLLLFSSC